MKPSPSNQPERSVSRSALISEGRLAEARLPRNGIGCSANWPQPNQPLPHSTDGGDDTSA